MLTLKLSLGKRTSHLFYYGKLIAFCFLLQIFCTPALNAQTWIMPVDGKVLNSSGDKLSGAIITLFKGKQQIQQVVTTSNGRFSFELLPNAEYIIAVTKPGCITKKFKINTSNVPPDRAASGGFNPFEPDVTLFGMPQTPEISKRIEAILSQPLAIYQYIPSETNFNYDEKYTQAIQDKLAELAQLQKQVEKDLKEKTKQDALDAEKQLEIDKKYKEAITKADAFFNKKDYSSAKDAYKESLTIKQGETYPKQKIAEIGKLLANADKQKEIDSKYNAAIQKADGAFTSKDYTSAKAAYTDASTIKPIETYPKTKLAEIDKLLAGANKQKEIDSKYNAAIQKADGAFVSKDYTSAKAGYTDASQIKPNETYPKTKLAEIDKLLASTNKQKDVDAKYNAAIQKADGAFASKDYTSAKAGYTDASQIKPNETYPKTKLAEIDKLLINLVAQKTKGVNDDQYNVTIAKADAAFNRKDYATAKPEYAEALRIKPSEQYPKDKIAEIEKLEQNAAEAQKQKENNLHYNDAISSADKLFSKKDYTASATKYKEALLYKPDEKYPKNRLLQISNLLNKGQSRDIGNTGKTKEDIQKSASEEVKANQYQSDLRSKYPPGVTQEEYSDNGKTILRKVVITPDRANVYTKVTHNWGGIYFFKDNTPITEIIFENESK